MIRRTFLQASAAAMGAAVAAPMLSGAAVARASVERWRMRLSTSSIQFGSLPVEQACEQIALLGFEAIDFWPAGPAGFGCSHLEEIESRLGAGGLTDLLAKHKLKLAAVTCYFVGYSK
jgi:hypothetical protein